MTKLKPYLVCKNCRYETGWNDREMGSRWYFCGKYHKLVGECINCCMKLRKGLVEQIQENIRSSSQKNK
jgi:hypothetical protein